MLIQSRFIFVLYAGLCSVLVTQTSWAEKQTPSVPAIVPVVSPRPAPPIPQVPSVPPQPSVSSTAPQLRKIQIPAAPQAKTVLSANLPQDSLLYHILQSRTVRVCVRSDIPPFGYFKEDTLRGFDVALAKELITALGIRYQTNLQRQWVVIQAAERVSSLQTGRCDLVVAAFSKTPERAKLINFSTVYYRTAKVVLRRTGEMSSAPVVAKVKGATGEKIDVASAIYSSFLGYSDILYTMKQKLVDFVITDYPIGRYLMRNSGAAYQLHNTLPQLEEYSVGVTKTNALLLREIDYALQQLRITGRLAHLRRQWLQ